MADETIRLGIRWQTVIASDGTRMLIAAPAERLSNLADARKSLRSSLRVIEGGLVVDPPRPQAKH